MGMSFGYGPPKDKQEMISLLHAAVERGARGLLSKHPRAGILWKILGVALLRQGQAALPELHRAAQLMPDDAEAQGNLGAALCDLGRWA